MGPKRNTRDAADCVVEPGAARRRRAERALVAAAALAFVLLRIPYVALPLERDEGEYAYVAWRMLEGDAPYRDAFDQKPPGVFAVYAALIALGQGSPAAIHLLLYAWTALCAVLLHRLVREMAGGLAAGFAALAFAALANDPRLTATAANTESLLLLPLLASWRALWRAGREGGARSWLACGAFSGAACWFKPVAATSALFAVAWAVAGWARARPRPPAAELVRRLALLALGAAGVSALFLGALAALGALGAFVEIVLVHNLAYSLQVSPGEGLEILRGVLGWLAPSHLALWLAAAFGLVWPRQAPRGARAFLGGQLAAAALGASVGLHFRPHYFVLLLPALCGLAGLAGAAAAERALAARRAPAAWAGFAALAALAVAPVVAGDRSFLFAGSPRAVSRELYGLNPFPESPEIAAHVAARSGPSDRVLVVGSEPQILYLAGRRSATRYILFYPLTGPYPDALERQRQALREVEQGDPLYVVWVQVDASLLVGELRERWILDELWARVQRDYRIELAVHLTPDEEDYVLARGAQAQRWLDFVVRARPETLWVGVFRRERRPGS